MLVAMSVNGVVAWNLRAGFSEYLSAHDQAQLDRPAQKVAHVQAQGSGAVGWWACVDRISACASRLMRWHSRRAWSVRCGHLKARCSTTACAISTRPAKCRSAVRWTLKPDGFDAKCPTLRHPFLPQTRHICLNPGSVRVGQFKTAPVKTAVWGWPLPLPRSKPKPS